MITMECVVRNVLEKLQWSDPHTEACTVTPLHALWGHIYNTEERIYYNELMLLRMMASFLSMLSLLLLYLLIGLSNGQLTTCNVRPNPFGISTPTTGQALGITFYIDINNPFTCYGVITKWRLCYKRSAGALSDTIRIGIYEPTDNGNQFVKRGSNSIHLQLQHSDCLNITANPQLVVREGYVLAFYATVAYIKFYDDTTNGYLYKSVAFPNSISRGVLIKTSNPYAPKLGAYIDPIDPSTTSTTLTSTGNSSNIIPSSDATNDTSNTMSGSISVIITPTPTSESGIPPPDLLSDQCLVGVNEAFVHSFEIKHTPYLSTHLPSQCNGLIERWELCYKHINELAEIQLGIWRPNNTNYVLVGYDDITVVPKYLHSLINPLVCTVVTSSDALLYIEEGDLIGFNSTDLSVAFTNRNINKRSTDNDFIPLIRAITSKQI